MLNNVMTILLIYIGSIYTYKKTQYQLLSYNELKSNLEKSKNSNLKKQIFKIQNIYEKYPGLPSPVCYEETDKKCKNFIIEMTNFEKGEKSVKDLPTVLLIGGMEGNSLLGANILYNFFRLIKNFYFQNSYIQNLLNKTRIIILPFVNINGFYKLEENETIEDISVNPNFDFPFNLQNGEKCFVSTTALILDTIFRSNLITSVLKFSNGANEILYPFLYLNDSEKEKKSDFGDNLAFEEVSKILQEIAGEVRNLDIPQYKIWNSNQNPKKGNFIDWAYSASWLGKKINKNCVYRRNEEKDFEDISYEDESNRAFAILIETGKDIVPNNLTLGNELAIFNEKSKHAVSGHISRNIKLIFGFIDFLKPDITIKKIYHINSFVHLDIIITGCVKINEVGIKNYFFFTKFIKRNSSRNEFFYKIKIFHKQAEFDLINIELKCDHHWKNGHSKKIAQSHFVRMKTDPNYKTNLKSFSLFSTFQSNFSILNLNLSRLSSADVIKEENIFNIIYTDYYQAFFGEFLLLFFYKENRIFVKFQKNEDIKEFEIQIHKFGTVGCCAANANGSMYLFKIKNGVSKKVTKDIFFNLLGRSVSLFIGNKKMNSIIVLGAENQESALMLPKNGLTCSSVDKNEDYKFFNVFEENDNINITLLTKQKADFSIQLNHLHSSLYFEKEFFSNHQKVFQFFTVIQIGSKNEKKIRGSILKLFDKDKLVFECFLSLKNPFYNEEDNLKYFYGFFIQKNDYVGPFFIPIFVISLLLFFCLLLSFFYTRNYKKEIPLKKEF